MNLSGNGQQEMLSPYVGTRQMTFLRGKQNRADSRIRTWDS